MTADPVPFDCPAAVITSVSVQRNYRGTIATVTITCPWCGRPHLHGIGNPDNPTLGHRVSHCTTTDRITPTLHSYVLVDRDGLLR
jgi:hypothetical protein